MWAVTYIMAGVLVLHFAFLGVVWKLWPIASLIRVSETFWQQGITLGMKVGSLSATNRLQKSEAFAVMPVKLPYSVADLNSSTGPKQWNTEKASNQKYTVSALYLKVGRVKTTEPYLQIVHINTIQAPLTLSNLVSFDQEPLAATCKHAAKDNDYIKWLFKSRAPPPGSDILH